MTNHFPDATKMVLSPTAQAVLNKTAEQVLADRRINMEHIAAAAIRAAAGSVPKDSWGGENYATGFRDGIAFSCQFLHELAAELEAAP